MNTYELSRERWLKRSAKVKDVYDILSSELDGVKDLVTVCNNLVAKNEKLLYRLEKVEKCLDWNIQSRRISRGY